MNHTLEGLRPIGLDARSTPVPLDTDLDSSPRPLQAPSGEKGQEVAPATFETPSSMRCEGEPGGHRAETETKDGESQSQTATCQDAAVGKVVRAWKRRNMVNEKQHDGEPEVPSENSEKKLEDELGEQMLFHFQQETVRLQSQNEMMARELQQLREERDHQKRLVVPQSWNGGMRSPTPPPRVIPSTQDSQMWVSPETYRCTPNGTRIPSDPPPDTPLPPVPPLPIWPPELALYELEPPRKVRGVMGDRGFHPLGDRASQVSGACSPRTARNFWLEQEVMSLKERLDQETAKTKALQGEYWSKPFQTEAQKRREAEEAVACLKRNAGVLSSVLHDPSNAHGEVYHQDRAVGWHEHGVHPLGDRACTEQNFGDPRLQARACGAFASELGERFGEARAGVAFASELGERCGEARAGVAFASELGDLLGGARAGRALERGDHHGRDRASISAERFGDDALRDRANLQGGVPQQRALRQDREVVEDGDLKSVPIQLPSLPSPEGREASLEAGDWIIQLEPLVGDLSKNATGWWRRIMAATTEKYSQWLYADPLNRLKITAPATSTLSAGYERLDQRVTSLLLQSLPKAIKDEVIAARELTTAGILFRVLRTFQPGGLTEKSRLLEDLTSSSTTKTVTDAVAALRLWKRKASRAAELCAQLPDPLLLVRALDAISRPIVDASSQASFRIATFRMNHNLDVRPSLDNIWLFYDLLLAEGEVAIHSSSMATTAVEPKTPPKPAVKALQSPSTGGKSSTSSASATWPCKFWLTDGGCRQGQRCRWPHPWENCTDKNARCWNCSSNQHQQQDCPYKAQVKPPVGGDGDGDGPKSKGKSGGKGKQKSKTDPQKSNSKENPQGDGKKDEGTSKSAGVTVDAEVKGKGESAVSSTGGGVGGGKKLEGNGIAMEKGSSELLSEATKLLQALQLPSIKKITLQELGNPTSSPSNLMLLDSGATHSLRRATSWEEWDQAHQTVVALAQGSTSNLRLKYGTNTLLSTPEDTSFGNGILPMGALAKIGYVIAWSGGDCRVHGPAGEKIEVQIINGCPMIERRHGMRLMQQLENNSRIAAARTAIVSAIIGQPSLMKQLPQLDPETLMFLLVKQEFPDLPDSICRRVVPNMSKVDSEQLPWNRRQRRKMLRSKRIILHLFSGPDEKTWKTLEDSETIVICVDKVLHPQSDILNNHLMTFLLKLAASGAICAIIGGPPCRSVSACRYSLTTAQNL